MPISLFARKLHKHAVANRSDFAVVQLEGFAPKKVMDMAAAFHVALGAKAVIAVILDRDYRTDQEVDGIVNDLHAHTAFVHVHGRKEIENYLLVPEAIQRAANKRIADHVNRGGSAPKTLPNVIEIMDKLSEEMKADVVGQYIARRIQERRARGSPLDPATVSAQAFNEFELAWGNRQERFRIVPGKLLLAGLNAALQESADINLTSAAIIEAMILSEVPNDITKLISSLDGLRLKSVAEDS